MEKVKAYKIGTPVYYFDDSTEGELKIKQSVIYGAFIHKTHGDLYYFLDSKNDGVAAYTVGDSMEDIQKKLEKFDEYRKDLMARTKSQMARFDKFKKQYMYPTYKQDYKVDESDAQEIAQIEEVSNEE